MAARVSRAGAGGPDGADQLPAPDRRLRHALLWLRLRALRPGRRLPGHAHRRRHLPGADRSERPLAPLGRLWADGVDLAPAHLSEAAAPAQARYHRGVGRASPGWGDRRDPAARARSEDNGPQPRTRVVSPPIASAFGRAGPAIRGRPGRDPRASAPPPPPPRS